MPPRNVLLLSDGRPGHQQLSEGIVAAILRRTSGACAQFPVRRRGPGLLASLAVNLRLPPGVLLSRIYGLALTDVPPADVIVSAGAETLAASIALARARRIPNLHYGSLRRFRSEDFTLVLTSYAGDADGMRRVFFAKPAGFDPDSLGPARRPADWPNGVARDIVLAVGGDAPGCRFSTADWGHLADLLVDGRTRLGIDWTVSNSRRTPDAVSDRLAALARGPEASIRRFVDVRVPGAARLSALLGPADALLVTADSSSMISEGIFARRPVLALEPEALDLGEAEAGYRRRLAAEKWMATAPMRTIDIATMGAALTSLAPQTTNPLDALADLIAARVPTLFG